MPFGPSQGETFVLLHLPLLISVVLAVCLLLSWRRFFALLTAALVFVIYVLVGASLLRTVVGALMLLFSAWAAVALLASALFVSTRKWQTLVPARPPQQGAEQSANPAPVGPPGKCPNCDATIPITSAECQLCGAVFAQGAAWKVRPL
jgi:hypothetical protein